ncbi:hypothetical protein [uncultured Gilvimarinus sp.]|uniref:hypothetical protein n=1 Tax=uncultured Gilvimarinus sp. TaxID=1689143 RepID=UPI0030DBFCFA
MQIACVLKQGPEYKPCHVYALADSILRHNPGAQIGCLTDVALSHPAITALPLRHGWQGWWSKLELFRPGLFDGPTLYLDLDTVVTGKLPPIGPRFTMLPNVYRQGDYGSGVMSWQRAPVHLYQRFAEAPAQFMRQYKTAAQWGDQAFVRDHLGNTPDTFGPEYRSYKVHCKPRVPSGTRVVYFHGNPRPWQVSLCL